jgi:cell division septum initiation protein DivIVA
MSSPENKTLQAIKFLAQQYKPLIDAMPELEQIVSLQDNHNNLKTRIDGLSKRKDELLVDIANHNKNIDELQKKATEIKTSAQAEANVIVANAKKSAEKLVSDAKEQGNIVINNLRTGSANITYEIQDKQNKLADMRKQTSEAQTTLNNIHKLIDELRKK